jgi:hypothetical protein
MRAVDVRSHLVRALRLDAIGPDPGEAEATEALPQSPSEWYRPRGRAFLPSSIGLSVLERKDAGSVRVTVTWGDYRLVKPEETGPPPEGESAPKQRAYWQRTPRSVEVAVAVGHSTGKPVPIEVPGSDGLRLVASVREVPQIDVGGDGVTPWRRAGRAPSRRSWSITVSRQRTIGGPRAWPSRRVSRCAARRASSRGRT